MPSRRCSACLTAWPTSISAAYCPECGSIGKLRYVPNVDPVDEDEAHYRLERARVKRNWDFLMAKFERFYETWVPPEVDPAAEEKVEIQRRLQVRRELEEQLSS